MVITQRYKLVCCLLFAWLLGNGLSSAAFAANADDVKAWESSYTLEINGEYEKAAAMIVPFLEAGDDKEYALMRYGWLNYMQGNFNDAIRSYLRALRQNTRSIDARIGITLPLMAQSRWKDAKSYAQQVLGMSPRNYSAGLQLLTCEEGLRQWQNLENAAASFLSYYPTDATAMVYLARAYAWQNKYELASRTYSNVLNRYPTHAEALTYVLAHPAP